jgi:hypothetical protein
VPRALLYMTKFGREMDKGRMNICFVHVGWLKMIDETMAIVNSCDLLSISEKDAIYVSIRNDYTKYMRDAFLAAHLLTPWLYEDVMRIKREDNDLFVEMRKCASSCLISILSHYDNEDKRVDEPRDLSDEAKNKVNYAIGK